MCHISLSLSLSLYISIAIYIVIFLACLTEGPSTDEPGECWKRASLCGSSGNAHTSCRRIFWAGMVFTMIAEVCKLVHSALPHPTPQSKPLFHSRTLNGSLLPRIQYETLDLTFNGQDIGLHPTVSSSSYEFPLSPTAPAFPDLLAPLSLLPRCLLCPPPHWISVFLQNSPFPGNPPSPSFPSSRN